MIFRVGLGLIALCMTACTGEPDPVDDSDTDSDTDTDTGDDVESVWKDMSIGTSSTLNAVYSGGTGAWVFGAEGSAWRVASGTHSTLSTTISEELRGIWGAGDGSSANLVIVGNGGTILNYTESTGFDLHDVGTANFTDVDGVVNDLTAVSLAGVYRFQGVEWSFEASASSNSLNSVFVSGTDAWAVGDKGTVVKRTESGWSKIEVPTSADLFGIDGAGDGTLWVVGEGGKVLHYNASGEWNVIESGVSVNLWAVWVSPDGVPVVVGNNGVAMMWDATYQPEDADTDVSPGAFIEHPTGVTSNLYSVHGTSSTNIWASGNRGQVLKYVGAE